MRFGGEIHRSTCRYKYQTRPRSLHPPISSFVGLCVDVTSLRICCVSWVLYGIQGFGILRFGIGRRNFKMQGIRRNKKENGCVPSIRRF